MTIRRSAFASAAVVMSAAGVWGGATAPATASPADEPSESAGCHYTLTPPQLVLLPGGAKAVRATLDPKICDPSAQPTDVTVCLAPPNGQGDCNRLPGWAKVEVIIPAAPSSGTFTATGNGCWHEITKSFRPLCRTTGPISSTF
ncbi:hypothetical protein [Mycobacterium avium]